MPEEDYDQEPANANRPLAQEPARYTPSSAVGHCGTRGARAAHPLDEREWRGRAADAAHPVVYPAWHGVQQLEAERRGARLSFESNPEQARKASLEDRRSGWSEDTSRRGGRSAHQGFAA